MKTIQYTDDQLSPETAQLVQKVLNANTSNFVEQVVLAKLDPKIDFRYLDLSYADFSDCDIRDFDFSGSNLEGVYGTNVKWAIGAPVLYRADTANSLFSHALSQNEHFSRHPNDFDIAQRLSGDYWANAVLGVEKLLQRDSGDGSSMKIAQAVFDDCNDATVRTNVLLFMKLGVESSYEHKAFIYNILSRYPNDRSLIVSCITAITAFYASHKDAYGWLVKFLSHKDIFVRDTAFRGVVLSSRFMEKLEDVVAYIETCQRPAHRRAFIARVAGSIGSRFGKAVYNSRTKQTLDFVETISESFVRSWDERDFADFRKQSEHKGLKSDVLLELFRAKRIAEIRRVDKKASVSFRYDSGI